ncbi:MAG: biopolymer transporter ExbD [Planctomycetes bacterium]|nr:biopolymer transporter ExbD [Planctomycetota bacterium]
MPKIRDEDEVFEVPLTALIDVVFLLLIFFLVATNFTRKEIDHKVRLPNAKGGTEGKVAPEVLVINLRKDGTIVVNGSIVTPDALKEQISLFHEQHPEKNVSIRGDAEVSYQRVMSVLGLCKSLGVENVDLPVEEPKEGTSGT